MRELPILFSTAMVLALLDNRKTVTRRLVRERDGSRIDVARCGTPVYVTGAPDDGGETIPRLYEPGQILYVKEAAWLWCRREVHGTTRTGRPKLLFVPVGQHVRYVATDPKPTERIDDEPAHEWRLKIGRFLPRWASRIRLEVVSERVERLHVITEEDARAEGVRMSRVGLFEPRVEVWHVEDYPTPNVSDSALWAFRRLWESIHGPGSWARNDWVRRIEFRRVEEARHVA